VTPATPAYEVYALKYGERATTACQFFYREASHEPLTLDFYVWLLMGGPHPILVDVGGSAAEAQTRGLRGYVSPATMVERLGVKPADVPLVLVTHLHWDHWAGHAEFPAAEFWIQTDEVAFWTGLAGRHEVYRQLANAPALGDLVRLNYAGRVRLLDGDREVLPGVWVHRVGGHTAGLQIVSVQTARGRVVLTSDASHFYRNLERRQPVQLITDLPEMLAAFEAIDVLAGAERLIVAGHDPLVAERFTRVEPGVIRIA
jgi:glyoxylase-like metal-dependent hydrolase (beta-lactamase superfamily II)